MDLAAQVAGDLQGQQRGRTEPEQAEPSAGLDAGHLERAVADDAAAQQRGGGEVVEAVRQSEREVGTDGDPGGVSAVAIPAGEPRVRAEVLAPARAEPADPAGGRQPGDAGAVADRPSADRGADALDAADDLMSRHDRQTACLQVAFDELEVGPTHGAGGDAEDELVRCRLGVGRALEPQR